MKKITVLLCFILSGCGAYKKQECMTRLEVLSLLVEINERDYKVMKPTDKRDLLRGDLSLERMRSGVHLTAYEKCQQDFRDLKEECSRKERGMFEESGRRAAEKTNAKYAKEIKELTGEVK